tara:strand:+ start:2789 stop:3838 length:1050 start_codon:yes stop_codon:yes gene_type:complete
MSITAWDTNPNNNGNRLATGNLSEGQAPSTLNDASREIMASIRRWTNELEWYEFGSGSNTTSYTRVSATQISIPLDVTDQFTINRRVKITDGQGTILFGSITASTFSSPNTTITINFDSGSLGSGNPTIVKFGIINSENSSLPSITPVGSIITFAGSTAPQGFLICDGSLVSKTTYAQLFAVCGTTYGAGNATQFQLPDLSSKFPLGKSGSFSLGSTGGAFAQTPAGTVSSSFTGNPFTPLGNISVSGTVAGHAITQAQLPNITLQSNELVKIEQPPANRGSSSGAGATYAQANIPLGGSGQTHSHGFSGSGTFSGTSSTPTGSVSASFSGSSIDITNPYLSLNYIIKH